MLVGLLVSSWAMPAWAGIDDDRYDGNIFALYGSNGALIPPRTTLKDSIKREMPAIVVLYVDDSRDCKQYAPVIASLQARYGIGINFLPYAVDSLDLQDPDGMGQYYTGQVPRTIIFNPSGDVVYQSVGKRPITEIENQIRALFDLEPVPEREEKTFNEIQTGFRQS